jgi:predicted nucleic-acid-binding protein
MHGLDTNVLVRFFAADDPAQYRRARRLLEKDCSEKVPGWISVVVLVETIWVLSKIYGYDKASLTTVITELLKARFLRLEDDLLIRKALASWQLGNIGFPDELIAARNLHEGCKTTYTFDRKAAKQSGFTAVP